MPSNIHRGLRRSAGFDTQDDLARHLGVSKSTVGNWECGYSPMPRVILLYLTTKKQRDKLLFRNLELEAALEEYL